MKRAKDPAAGLLSRWDGPLGVTIGVAVPDGYEGRINIWPVFTGTRSYALHREKKIRACIRYAVARDRARRAR